jgi:hypothetical protein
VTVTRLARNPPLSLAKQEERLGIVCSEILRPSETGDETASAKRDAPALRCPYHLRIRTDQRKATRFRPGDGQFQRLENRQ